MNNRYILCSCAPGQWGKSSTLKKLVEILEAKSIDFALKLKEKGVNDSSDIWCVFQSTQSNKTIIIQTEGDYTSSFNQTIEYLKTHGVDILVCASRCERTNVYKKVKEVSNDNNMEIIRFQNYHYETNNNLEVLLNEQMAQSIYNLILQLIMK